VGLRPWNQTRPGAHHPRLPPTGAHSRHPRTHTQGAHHRRRRRLPHHHQPPPPCIPPCLVGDAGGRGGAGWLAGGPAVLLCVCVCVGSCGLFLSTARHLCTQVVSGWGHTLVLAGEQVLAWGWNRHGQCGLGHTYGLSWRPVGNTRCRACLLVPVSAQDTHSRCTVGAR
jgi:hypothetical protein